jgi:hypothetical protein
MCLVRPVEAHVHVVIQWVVRTEHAVGEAVGAMQNTERLQRALQQAFNAVGGTNQTVQVRNVTARILDASNKEPGTGAATPIPTSGGLETETVMVAAIGGLALVGVAWVMSRRPWDTGPVPAMGQALQPPVIRVRLRRE